MVTAETAVILPFLVATGLLLLWVVSLGITHVQLVDASREGARMIARGDSAAQATRVAKELAPADSDVDVATRGGFATVTVRATAAFELPFFADVTQVRLEARSVSSLEELP